MTAVVLLGKDVIAWYWNLSADNFPVMFDAYVEAINKGSSNPGSDAHHEEMAANYIDNIARGLQEFDVINHNNPEITFDHYQALAWVGLQGTHFYVHVMSQNEKDDIDFNRQFIISHFSLLNCK